MYKSKYQDCFFNLKASKISFDLLKKNMRNVENLNIEICKYIGGEKNNLERMLYKIENFREALNNENSSQIKSILQKVAGDVFNYNYTKEANQFIISYEQRFGYSVMLYSNMD